jgi:hypothetical protein
MGRASKPFEINREVADRLRSWISGMLCAGYRFSAGAVMARGKLSGRRFVRIGQATITYVIP